LIGIYRRHHGDAKRSSYCAPGQALLVAQSHHFISPKDPLRATYVFAVRFRGTNANKCAFADHLALELGNRGQDVKQQPTCGT
jgi:hypothetical protein